MSVSSKGLEGVVATDTKLGDVRGQEGELIYCGYNIKELAGKASFEEVIYLLWHLRLPNRAALEETRCQSRFPQQKPGQAPGFPAPGFLPFSNLKPPPGSRISDGR